jgi:hypothetical protein
MKGLIGILRETTWGGNAELKRLMARPPPGAEGTGGSRKPTFQAVGLSSIRLKRGVGSRPFVSCYTLNRVADTAVYVSANSLSVIIVRYRSDRPSIALALAIDIALALALSTGLALGLANVHDSKEMPKADKYADRHAEVFTHPLPKADFRNVTVITLP